MYVPGAVTVFTFEGWSTPSRSRCQPWLCRSPELPMLSNGSLYSLTVHVEDSVTGAPPLVQFQLPAWLRPRLCPISWPVTRTVRSPLIHDSLPGR